MLFNSFQFAIFFAIVYALYLVLSHQWQNRMLLVASYVFYGAWDWRFLFLLFLSTVLDYVWGLLIHQAQSARRKRVCLVLSITGSLTILGFFKYFNFFASSLQSFLGWFDISMSGHVLNVILPVGVSFYTFQSMSYVIDVYRGKVVPTRQFLDFALFVAFFPQLVAGPISRAGQLLPQMQTPRKVTLAGFAEGVRLIFWGLFKKVFVADNLALFVEGVFASNDPSGFAVICGVYGFAFQIYCDFSGYSDIARGAARCMGFDLMVNFNNPYISESPREFWARWHISLSTWLRDYLYVPLGGNRGGRGKTFRNLGLTMLLGGLWHGAQWKFVLWGAYHGTALIIHRLLEPALKRLALPAAGPFGVAWRCVKIALMFQVISLGWLIFRAHNVSQIVSMAKSAFTLSGAVDWALALPLLKFAGPLILVEIVQSVLARERVRRAVRVPAWARCAAYAVFFYLLAFYGASSQSFIYFQF